MSLIPPQDIVAGSEGQALHIGEQLRLMREARGLTLTDVSKSLYVSTDYLGAIERLDKDALPSLGYVLGFMRSYAKFLGLDEKEAVERYKVESEIPRDLGMRDCPHFVQKREIRLPKGSVTAGIIVSCCAVLAVWYGSNTEARSAQLTATPVVASPNVSFTTELPIQSDPNIFTLKATGPSWVEILDAEGTPVMSKIFVAGDRFEARLDVGMSLSARDGGALELYRGDVSVGTIGVKGERVDAFRLQ